MPIKWTPSIRSILGGSGGITLFLGIIIFMTCFIHASSSPSLPVVNALIQQYTGSTSADLGVLGLAFLEAQIWVPSSCLSTSINFLNIELPPFFLYYLVAFSAGFLASLAFLRKDSRIVDSLIVPLVASLYIVIGMVILGLIIHSLIGAATEGSGFTLSIDASGYLLIFLINWIFFTIGTFSAAALKQFIHHMWNATPSEPVKKK